MEGKEPIFQIFSELMAKVAIFEELADVACRLLAGFHQGLEFLRRPPINKISDSIAQIFQANETECLLAYVGAGCVKVYDNNEHISKLHSFHAGLNDHLAKAKCILEELEGLVQKMASEIPSSIETNPSFENDDTPNEFDADGISSFESQKTGVRDYAALTSIIFVMVKQDFCMQEKIISSLSIKTSSGELESYSLMLSLRPYINDGIMHQALRLLIP